MKKLFEKQAKLDDLIVKNLCERVGKEITHRQLINQRLLSVSVEIGEFVKEKDHDLKKEEFIDCLHFLLSCGLAVNISECIEKHDINILYAQSIENNYSDAILNFNVKFSDFCNAVRSWKYWSVNREPKHNIEKYYFKCFLALFDIAKTMQYTVQEIKAAYGEKNRTNIIRQKTNY